MSENEKKNDIVCLLFMTNILKDFLARLEILYFWNKRNSEIKNRFSKLKTD